MHAGGRERSLFGFKTVGNTVFLFVLHATALLASDLASARTAVIGAGVAGLVAASELRRAGQEVEVFEQSDRVGGRLRSTTLNGDRYDLGGELIDSRHQAALQLARDLGLTIEDRTLVARDRKIVLIGKDVLSLEAFTERVILETADGISALASDVGRLHDRPLRELDKISAETYLSQRFPPTSLFASWITGAFESEVGKRMSEVPATALLSGLQIDFGRRIIDFLPQHDERFWIRGGNETLAEQLAEPLVQNIRFQHQVKGVRYLAGSGYYVEALSPTGAVSLGPFESIFIALPIDQVAQLQTDIPEAQSGFEDLKWIRPAAITKIVLQFDSPFWRDVGRRFFFQGAMGWDSTPMGSQRGLFTVYTRLRDPSELEDLKTQIIRQLSLIDPSVSRKLLGSTHFDWPSAYVDAPDLAHPTSHDVLQRTRFGKIFLIGEAFGGDDMGYINGAITAAQQSVQAFVNESQALDFGRRNVLQRLCGGGFSSQTD